MLERQRKNLKQLEQNSSSKAEEIIVKFIYVILFIAYNLFELWLVYLIGKYNGVAAEMVFIVLNFFCNKAIYGKPLHFKSNIKCLIVSIITFYASSKCVISFDTSILSSIIIGVLCGCITSYIATYLYNGDIKKETKRETIIRILNNDLSQEHIFEYCKSVGLKDCIADTVELFLSNTLQETSNILAIDLATVKRRIDKFIKSANQ